MITGTSGNITPQLMGEIDAQVFWLVLHMILTVVHNMKGLHNHLQLAFRSFGIPIYNGQWYWLDQVLEQQLP